MCLLHGTHVNSPETRKLKMLMTDLSCSWVLVVNGLVYFTGQLAILMTLNDFKCTVPYKIYSC